MPGLPWASVLAVVLAVAWLLLLADPRPFAALPLPPVWQRPEFAHAIAAVAALLLLWDFYRLARGRSRQRSELRRLAARIDELMERNKQLQLKAHTYSDHADKLKLFISDKLLEYIEYDAKFLHFKGIAAEVRHNGVISFDKVQTALQHAADSAPTDTGSEAPPRGSDEYRDALDAMRYLWDLLDLSTADNLALHIANLLCECEEQYCQRMLGGEDEAALPYEPAFDPRRAAWRALAGVRDDLGPPPGDDMPVRIDDEQWHVRLEPVGELLGKENHLVLLLENLLRNARFFAGKRGYSAVFAPIAVRLDEAGGHARLRVYNRGPAIDDAERHRLFQLGYSTRRRREHHGRGLGLYFVNEIVKGYEGRIDVTNIETPPARYRLRLVLDDGTEVRHTVEVAIEEGRPCCLPVDGVEGGSPVWELRSRLERVEVTSSEDDAAAVVEDFARKGREDRFDPAHPARPRWRLRYQHRRRGAELAFEPLAIDGVEFEVRLPTARQRLEDTGPPGDADIEAEVDRLGERLRPPGA